jgi:hypothetical protein
MSTFSRGVPSPSSLSKSRPGKKRMKSGALPEIDGIIALKTEVFTDNTE